MKSIGDVMGERAKCGRCGKAINIVFLTRMFEHTFDKPIYCNDCLEILETQAAKDEAKWRREQIVREYPRYARIRGLPTTYHAAAFDTLDVDADNIEAVNVAREFVDRGGMMYLYGSAGRGKTWIAAAVVRELILRDRQVRFAFCGGLLNDIKECFKDKEKVNKALHEYKVWPWLVIDDIKTKKPSEWVEDTIFDILNYRHAWMKPTVITSNMPLSKLSEIFGARLASRIKEYDMVVEVKGKDRRIK